MSKIKIETEEFILAVQIIEIEKTLKMLEGLLKQDKKQRIKRALNDLKHIVGNMDEREDLMQFSDVVGEFFQEFRVQFNQQLEEKKSIKEEDNYNWNDYF